MGVLCFSLLNLATPAWGYPKKCTLLATTASHLDCLGATLKAEVDLRVLSAEGCQLTALLPAGQQGLS